MKTPTQPLSALEQPLKLRIFISTGEVSGDLQGALLIHALQRQAASRGYALEIVATGGDRMAQAGATLLGNTSAIGAVGILESLPYLVPTLRLQGRVKQYLRNHPPDLAVLIDYMGPNLAIGSYLRQTFSRLPLVYYIAPQQWVWGAFLERDTRRILDVSDRLLAIFPEEAKFYQRYGGAVTWVGHPLIDRIPHPPDRQQARAKLGLAADATVVTLLPASRQQELRYLLPVILKAAQQIQAQLPAVQFLIPASLPQFQQTIQQAIAHYQLSNASLTADSQTAIAAADLAITKSGTVNLEIALMNVPQVVCYRLNPVTAWVAQHLLNFSAPFISPVNLVEMRSVVPEFLQWQATPAALATAALTLLLNEDKQQQMLANYQSIRQTLGEPGVCDRAAAAIFEVLLAA
ncbi:lipid-A-disaccharide synthase [Almyronema epifaneia]|uniref:Lipid-A-disaccharide synthase n=1 Tax=Almyronema epifaneia S1 TaxID=2991925 RepID=A0ABW6IBA0_9CYAN